MSAPDEDIRQEILREVFSRLLLTAQEDLRREIARAMHDGPAQSLTNIVLQAQIVERLVLKDPQMENVRSLTLSYTFFEVGAKTPPAPTAGSLTQTSSA